MIYTGKAMAGKCISRFTKKTKSGRLPNHKAGYFFNSIEQVYDCAEKCQVCCIGIIVMLPEFVNENIKAKNKALQMMGTSLLLVICKFFSC
jgi:hypothetical protein